MFTCMSFTNYLCAAFILLALQTIAESDARAVEEATMAAVLQV